MIYYKETEDIILLLDAIGHGLEIIPAVTYKGSSIESIRTVYHHSESERNVEIYDSRLQKLIMEFNIVQDDEEKDIKVSMYYPVLIDRQYFLLNGCLYTPVYQLIDSGTYRTKKNLVLRTLIMPIIMKDVSTKFIDTEDNEHNSKTLYMNLFKKEVNMFVYYFAAFGMEETLSYFGMDEVVYLIDLDEYDFPDEEDFYNFKMSKGLGISIDKEWMELDENNPILANTFLSNFSNRVKLDKALEKDYWVRQLGSKFTKNNSMHFEKGENILVSFRRTLDDITKLIYRVPEKDKQDIFTIVRYMAMNFKSLSRLDSMDLSNKRLRLNEYMLYPLVRKFSKGIYRLLNKKNLTFKEVVSIFNIQSGFLIKALIKNEDLRYINSVNSFDIFSVALKGTQSGPQSPFKGNSSCMELRNIHPSYMGKIDLVSTSAGDPGVGFVLTPYFEPKEFLHFTDSVDMTSVDEDMEDEE
jgi:hypothetical protein